MGRAGKEVNAAAHNLRWLYIGRALRSFSTAFLTVAFPLYLATAGYDAVHIGLVLTASGAMTVLLVTGVGLAGDRYGRRNVILVLSALAVFGGIGMALGSAFWLVVLASGLGGVGRGGGAGSGGSWGPVFPVEQPLIAASVGPRERTQAFGVLSFVGVLAGAAGSLVAAIPELLHQAGWTWVASYHALFALGAVVSLIMVLVTIPIKEPAREAPPAGTGAPQISTRQLLGRLGLTNALNGLGFGFLGPLLTYWFYRRFGAGPAELGVLYTIVNLATALPYLWSSRLVARLGAVRTVTATRGIGLALMFLMALVPQFWEAAVLFTVRMMFNSLGMPARQSFVMGVSDDRWRSRISAFSSLPSQVTSMISPAVGGALMASFIDIPIIGGAFFMSLNLVAYYFAFKDVKPPDETHTSPVKTLSG